MIKHHDRLDVASSSPGPRVSPHGGEQTSKMMRNGRYHGAGARLWETGICGDNRNEYEGWEGLWGMDPTLSIAHPHKSPPGDNFRLDVYKYNWSFLFYYRQVSECHD